MNKPLVSIVVPVYNSHKYLRECVDSLVNQDYENIEIILVDDGSTDNSFELCQELAQKDERIKIISKNNEGAGLTRNVGLKVSTGEYITFLDSDDVLRNDTISTCVNIAEKYSIEFILYGSRIVDEKMNELYKSIPKTMKCLYREDEVIDIFLADRISTGKETLSGTSLQYAACMACFYDNRVLKSKQWKFASERDVYSEDFYSQLKLFKWIKSVYVIEDDLYFYRQNGESLSHNSRVADYELIKEFYRKCIEVANENEYGEVIKKRLIEPFISYSIVSLKHIAKNFKLKKGYSEIKRIVDDRMLVTATKNKDKTRDNIKRKFVYYLIEKEHVILIYLLMRFC